MPKSVRYKLKKPGRPKKRRTGNRAKVRLMGKKNKFLSKSVRIFFFMLLVSIFSYWIFVAYTTVRDIKITDVVGKDSEILEFASSSRIRRTLIIYEDPNSTDRKNLFILAVIHNPETSEALIYYYPGKLFIKDYFAGQYISIENLTYAGHSYMYDEKYAYVIRQIEEQMALSFDSYILFGSEVSKNFVSNSENWGYSEEDVYQLFSKLSFLNLMPRYYKVYLFEEYFHSNMSFLEMYSYFQSLRGIVSSDNQVYINLGDKEMFTEITLGSGRNANILNMGVLDKSLRDNLDILRTRDLRREHVKVEVYNGSDIPGYARTVSRRIFNSGCRVIRYENASRLYDQTSIYVSDMDKFVHGLGIVNDIVQDAVVVEGRPDFLTTGDIVVVLGLDQ